jgi:hypothetical protein|tara:strand:+ start:26329 stop:26835 length:507 start_codon:yes stop_codon:yes gene_type:complete
MNIDFDEISPITGNKCVVVEAEPDNNVISYLCMESGYTTTDQLISDGAYLEKHEAELTSLMIDVKFTDKETNLVWYPTFMQMPGGMLYPEGEPKKFEWKVAKVISIFGEERLQYPIPGKEGEYFTSKLDVDNANSYNMGDFKNALEDLYSIVKETIDNENKLRDNSMQ